MPVTSSVPQSRKSSRARTKTAMPPPKASFWSRFFCRGAELMSPSISATPSDDADSPALTAVKDTNADSLALPADARTSLPSLRAVPHPPSVTDSSDNDDELLATPLQATMSTDGTRRASAASSPQSPTSRTPSRSCLNDPNSPQQKAMSRERLYDSIRAVRVPRCARRGGGCGSFSPQKARLAVRADRRVLAMPADSGASVASADASCTTTARSVHSTDTNASSPLSPAPLVQLLDTSLTTSARVTSPPPSGPDSQHGSTSRTSGTHASPAPPAFQIKDTRFFPGTGELISPSALGEMNTVSPAAAATNTRQDDDDNESAAAQEEARHLAQALTEKRIQQQQQKAMEEKRKREEALALRELEREQRDAAAAVKEAQGPDNNNSSDPPRPAVFLTERLLAAHKRAALAPVMTAAVSEDGDAADHKLSGAPSVSSSAEGSESYLFEDDKMPGVGTPSLPPSHPLARGLAHLTNPLSEDVTQCAMPSAGAGAARLVRAMHQGVVGSPPGSPVSSSTGAAAALASGGAHGETRTGRQTSKYPLNSRAYVERVILGDRRQQALALLFLLDETHRFAWEWHLKLLQFYHYYFQPILAAVPDQDTRDVLEKALLSCGSGSVRKVHAQFYRDGHPVDYQQYYYEFEETWRRLFQSVRTYLDVPRRGGDVRSRSDFDTSVSDAELNSSSASEAGAGGDRGTVGFAATLLHSMELFQRQQEVQNAAQEANDWTLWFYYIYLPAVQSGQPPPMPVSSVRLADDRDDHHTASHEHSEGSTPNTANTPTTPDVLPMKWHEAQDATLRSRIFCARRQSKLKTIKRADKRLRQQRREAASQASMTDTGTDASAVNDHKAPFSSSSSSASTSSSKGTSDSTSSASSLSSSPNSSDGSETREQSAVEARPLLMPSIPAQYPAGCSLTDMQKCDETLQLRVLAPTGLTPASQASDIAQVKGHGTEVGSALSPTQVVLADGVASPTADETLEDYRVVNVGCFGFSFWSRADW